MVFQVKFFQVMSHKISQFDMLQVLPQPFDGVQVGRITGEPSEENSASEVSHEVLHCLSPVNWRSVPYNQQARSYHTQQMRQEFDHVQSVERFVSHHRINSIPLIWQMLKKPIILE
jgi:hypothetical protein